MSTERSDRARAIRRLSRRAQRGVAAVEFALGAMVFFVFIFGMFEMARAMYLVSTLVEVNRRAARAAASADMGKESVRTDVLGTAMFEKITGGLPLRGSLTKDNLKVEYLTAALQPVNFAANVDNCPEQNLYNCATDPDGSTCIRFVRVRLCAAVSDLNPDGTPKFCSAVNYVPLVGIGFPGGALRLPTFVTTTPVGTLGYRPGTPICTWDNVAKAYKRG